MSNILTKPDAWTGGLYEMSIPLGSRNDNRLTRALEAIWKFPDIEGCYLERTREPQDQARVGVPADLEMTLYGIARIPGKEPFACATHVVRFDGGEDWLSLSLPLGSLATVMPVGAFPLDQGGDKEWRPKLDEWLCGIARHVFKAVMFRFALIGWEPDEEVAAGFSRVGVPDERWVGYLLPGPKGLRWFPPNRGAPSFSIDPGR